MSLAYCGSVGSFGVERRDDALRIFEPGRLHDAADRRRHVVDIVGGLPADFGGLLDGLSRELGRGDVEEHVGARVLELDHLAVDGRIGNLVGDVRYDQLVGILAEPLLEAVEVVLAVVVVLHQHADLRVLDVGQDVLGVDDRLGHVVGLEAHGPREVPSGRPTWRRRSPRTAAAPSWHSCTCGSRCSAACRESGTGTAPCPPPPACAPSPPSWAGSSRRRS